MWYIERKIAWPTTADAIESAERVLLMKAREERVRTFGGTRTEPRPFTAHLVRTDLKTVTIRAGFSNTDPSTHKGLGVPWTTKRH